MTHDLPTIVLDISRTVSRLASGEYSGVDRVEQAYIRHVLDRDGDVFFLSSGLGGFAILDRAGMKELMEVVENGGPLGKPDLLSLLGFRQSSERKRAESEMRRHAVAVTVRSRLPVLLRSVVGGPFVYIGASHSNRAKSTLDSIRLGGGRSIALLIHDTIPIDHPEYSSAAQRGSFEGVLDRSGRSADILVFNSHDTQRRAERWLADRGVKADGLVAHLGTNVHTVGTSCDIPQPFFLTLGTIEPRKNHKLLLDVWRRFWEAPEGTIKPRLDIIGRRGWENADVFERLDNEPFMGELVFEQRASDSEVAAMLGSAHALLFPTFAEGFGLPLTEAMSAGCPAICSDIGTLREVGGDYPVYLPSNDTDGWFKAISELASGPIAPRKPRTVPSWDDHFDIVFGQIAEIDERRRGSA
jgi:glycosyltransferase involved in cell wall biosynthesis